jgi:hypothetical protein
MCRKSEEKNAFALLEMPSDYDKPILRALVAPHLLYFVYWGLWKVRPKGFGGFTPPLLCLLGAMASPTQGLWWLHTSSIVSIGGYGKSDPRALAASK